MSVYTHRYLKALRDYSIDTLFGEPMEYSQQKRPNADLHLQFSLELIKVPNEKHVNIPLMTAISPFIFFFK